MYLIQAGICKATTTTQIKPGERVTLNGQDAYASDGSKWVTSKRKPYPVAYSVRAGVGSHADCYQTAEVVA
jgi:hypothetical protein